LTVYVLGLGFGPMISAPISETLGRKSVYMTLFPASLLFTLGAGFSQTLAPLIICRFFAGLLGSACLAVGAGTNSDLYTPLYRATASAWFVMAPFAGPVLGPALGGYVAMNKGWRWTQWLILFWGVISCFVTIFGSETYKRIVLQNRAKRLSIPGPSDPLPPGMSKMHFIFIVTILRPMRMLFTEPIVVSFSLYTAFNFSVLFAFFVAFPIVFQSPYPEIQVYHFNAGEGGLVFLGLGLGVISATIIFTIMDRMIYRRKTLAMRANGDFSHLPPEERLYPAMIGAFLLPIGLFWFAWSAKPSVHWISPVLATIPFGVGSVLVFSSCLLYLMDVYGPMAGASAAAANGLLRYMLGAGFPLFTSQM
jgi:multidrug resistance protein